MAFDNDSWDRVIHCPPCDSVSLGVAFFSRLVERSFGCDVKSAIDIISLRFEAALPKKLPDDASIEECAGTRVVLLTDGRPSSQRKRDNAS